MKDIPVSNCEKEFILDAIANRKRLDGRGSFDFRDVKITFGSELGCVFVCLGDTKVLAQISCSVTQPKLARPSEGIVFVNVELSAMASPAFEEGRPSEQEVEISRILERCIKESHCIDTESLCIMAGIKVWQVRADIRVLNHEGNLMDACSIASITALAHFKRPDVSVEGENVIIHSQDDKAYIPLNVHHMPICVTFSMYHKGDFMLVDATEKEERVMDGKIIVAMNKHREICALKMTGQMLIPKEQVLRCSNIAVVKVAEITHVIQTALANDTKERAPNGLLSAAPFTELGKVSSLQKDSSEVQIPSVSDSQDEELPTESSSDGEIDSDTDILQDIVAHGQGYAAVGTGGPSKWTVTASDDKMDDSEEEVVQVL